VPEVEWDAARCRQLNLPPQYVADVFHPFTSDRELIALSRDICATCPIQIECREYARAKREHLGTYGGETEWERSSFLRREHRRRLRAGA